MLKYIAEVCVMEEIRPGGHRVRMRKTHPCGSDEWTVIRIGADIKIKCLGCGRIVMMERADFVKRRKKVLEQGPAPEADTLRAMAEQAQGGLLPMEVKEEQMTQVEGAATGKPGKEKKPLNVKKEILSWILTIAVAAAAAALLIRTFLFEPIRVDRESMCDTLQDGEIMLVTKPEYLFGDPQRGVCGHLQVSRPHGELRQARDGHSRTRALYVVYRNGKRWTNPT